MGELLGVVKKEVKRRLEDLLLQDSFKVNQYLQLPMEERVQQVGRPQRAKVFQLPPETRVIEVFTREEIAGRLLILGEPGSGKTITLLQLAQELIEQAETDSTAQVPVIFELSTWKSDKQSTWKSDKQSTWKSDKQLLEQWLVAQLKDIYSIDRKVSQKWLENERILPLLDGLDELGLPRQRLAIQAINQYLYLKQDMSRRLVVCCRWEEYRRGKKKLNELHGAYYLQPPSDSVIRDYLQSFGQQQLWSKIDSNPLMKELAQKPLFLNFMIPTFQGEAILSEEKLFENYIAWQLDPDNHDPRKYPQGVPYTEEDTKHWLSYLARNLSADSLTVFLLEKMQAYWLKPSGERLAFRLILGLIYGLSYGLILGLIGGLIYGLIYGLLGLSSGLIYGLIYGLLLWNFEEYEIMAEAFAFSWEDISSGLSLGLSYGLSFGLIGGLSFGLIGGLSLGLSSGLSLGLSYGLILGLIGGLIYGLSSGLKTEIKTREIPNQGIKEAWKKSLIIPFFTFPLCVLILPLTSLATGVTFSWQRYIGVGLAVAMTTSLVTGGEDWIQHLALRLILWLRRKIPWDYARFLNYAAERRLLQKTGGRYRFFHDSLRQHFCGDTSLPSHTIEITRNQWLGYVLTFFLILSYVILSNSIYPVDLPRASLLAPIVQTNDVTLSDIITYRWRNYQRGDVIEFWIDKELARQGFNPDLNYIMRIIGLPGETFEIKQGQVYINGQILSADYLDNLPIENYDQVKIEIPADLYLVMGKNVAQEEESLVASLVYKEQILNRIIFRLWPLERWGRVK